MDMDIISSTDTDTGTDDPTEYLTSQHSDSVVSIKKRVHIVCCCRPLPLPLLLRLLRFLVLFAFVIGLILGKHIAFDSNFNANANAKANHASTSTSTSASVSVSQSRAASTAVAGADAEQRNSHNNNNNNKKNDYIAERFLYIADAWVNQPSGFFGETYFARKLMRTTFDHTVQSASANAVDTAALGKGNRGGSLAFDCVPLLLYILNGDNIISETETDLLVKNVLGWIATFDPLRTESRRRQEYIDLDLELRGIIASADLDEESAKKKALEITSSEYWAGASPDTTDGWTDYTATVNGFLYDALVIAGSDTLHENEMAHFYSVAADLGIASNANAIFDLYQSEKQLQQTFDQLFS